MEWLNGSHICEYEKHLTDMRKERNPIDSMFKKMYSWQLLIENPLSSNKDRFPFKWLLLWTSEGLELVL